MAGRAGKSLVLVMLLCKQVICWIDGPSQLSYLAGDNAHFRWNNTNTNPKILSATWGIKKDDIANPQFISVDILSSKVYISSDLKPDLMSRVSFDGDLKNGDAWFILKNVTVNDTNEYLASISDDVHRVLPYTVVLTVKERENINKRNELGDTTSKEPDTNQVVPSQFPQIVNTTTAGTQVNVSEDTEKPASLISKVVIILIAVIFAMSFLVFAVAVVINCKNKMTKPDRPGTDSNKKELTALA